MMLPPNVSQPMTAAHNRGSMNVFVDQPKLSFEAMTTLLLPSRSAHTWNHDSAAQPSVDSCCPD